MAKDPAFLFYPGDYISGTMGMTFEQKGAYIELLMLQFNRGHMTKDMIAHTVGQLWGQIEDKFIQDTDGLYFNERLDLEKQRRKDYTASRRNNKNGINQYSKKDGHTTGRMEDVDKNTSKEEKIIKKDKIPNLVEFLIYADQLCQKTNTNFHSLKFAIESKYQTWVDDGWKTGHGKPIKNWKNTLSNTFPHLKAINRQHGQSATEDHKRVFDELDGSKLSQGHNK